MTDRPPLAPGLHPVAPGHLATVVTHLQLTARPPARDMEAPGVTLDRREAPTPAAYRALYARVGTPWLWQSRLAMADDALAAILSNPAVRVFALRHGGRDEGLLELDFGAAPDVELAFFGVTAALQGTRAARWMMERALDLAFDDPRTRRLWVHTCTLDHSAALGFYRRTGFAPYATEVEVLPDPRLAGVLPRDAGPHVPLLDADARSR